MTVQNSPTPESTATVRSGTPQSQTVLGKVWSWLKKVPPVYPVFLVIYFGVAFLHPEFIHVNGILLYLKRSAPAVVLAIGELFVLASGGFDLSMGAVVTSVTIVSAMLINNHPEHVWWAIAILLAIGILVGFINGSIVSYAKVPSFIVTLGMQLVITGIALYISGGAPKGYLTDNYRALANDFLMNVPVIGRFPYAVMILIVLAAVSYYLFHRANFGRQILAVGDNQTAAKLSGVKVAKVRILTFMYSGFFASVGGILVSGYGGVNIHAGNGLELNAIAAAVLGGTVLGGGRGSVLSVVVGSLALEALFTLLNFLGLPKVLRDSIQGLIIIGAVAYLSLNTRKRK